MCFHSKLGNLRSLVHTYASPAPKPAVSRPAPRAVPKSDVGTAAPKPAAANSSAAPPAADGGGDAVALAATTLLGSTMVQLEL